VIHLDFLLDRITLTGVFLYVESQAIEMRSQQYPKTSKKNSEDSHATAVRRSDTTFDNALRTIQNTQEISSLLVMDEDSSDKLKEEIDENDD